MWHPELSKLNAYGVWTGQKWLMSINYYSSFAPSDANSFFMKLFRSLHHASCMEVGGWRCIKSERTQCEYDDYNTLVILRLMRMAPPFMLKGTKLPLWKCSILHTTLFPLKFNSCSQSAVFLLQAVVCVRVFFFSKFRFVHPTIVERNRTNYRQVEKFSLQNDGWRWIT